MSMLRVAVVTLCFAIAGVAQARAAVLEHKSFDRLSAIYVSGTIVPGDSDRFKRIAASIAGPVVVVLSSPGGVVMEGLVIGEAIRASGYATAVLNAAECASTCGFIWLAGSHRYVGESANIGFHAAYVGSGDDMREAGVGNALVGAYLAKLGLSYDAIAFATSAGPREVRWLHPADAQRLGIQADILPEPQPDRAAATPTSRATQASPDDGSPLRRRMMTLVLSYYASWSGSGTDVDGLARFYGDTVAFYGASKSRMQIIAAKKNFSVRWPERHYAVKMDTLAAQCTDTCSVTGVVEWDVSSPERSAHSIGAANFVLKIAPAGSGAGGLIFSENGIVLSAHNDIIPAAPQASAAASTPAEPAKSPQQQASSTTEPYAEGRQARIIYENWFNMLPEGPYRDGATFWAENRSLRTPPSCAPAGSLQAWQQGCHAARSRLAAIDRRRQTDKDYWWGWNSP